MHHPATRTASSLALAAGMALALSARGSAPVPPPPIPDATAAVPVAPTVPAPVPPARNHVRFQNLLPNPNGAKAGEAEKADPAPAADAGPELSLGECLAVAAERNPQLRAVRASGTASALGAKSLANFGTVGTVVSPDLEIRKQQAQRGLAASAAEYQKAHNEVVEDVTRLYYTAVYARQQEAIAADVIGQVKELIQIANKLLETEPDPRKLEGLNRAKVLVMEEGLGKVRQKQVEARTGERRALAALRERMGVDERTFPFRLKDKELPVMRQDNPITKELVIDLALCRRPELALVAAAVDAFRLEVYAQGKVPFKRVVPTFASGSDLHSKEIPHPMRGSEYRPGGVAPELPPQLVGNKMDRVSRAMAFGRRAEAVFDSVRGLVNLDAENGYYEFEAATDNLRIAGERLKSALALQSTSRENAPNVKDKSLLVQAELLASATQSEYLQAVYQHLLKLAALERVTAGGIKPAFPGRECRDGSGSEGVNVIQRGGP